MIQCSKKLTFIPELAQNWFLYILYLFTSSLWKIIIRIIYILFNLWSIKIWVKIFTWWKTIAQASAHGESYLWLQGSSGEIWIKVNKSYRLVNAILNFFTDQVFKYKRISKLLRLQMKWKINVLQQFRCSSKSNLPILLPILSLWQISKYTYPQCEVRQIISSLTQTLWVTGIDATILQHKSHNLYFCKHPYIQIDSCMAINPPPAPDKKGHNISLFNTQENSSLIRPNNGHKQLSLQARREKYTTTVTKSLYI